MESRLLAFSCSYTYGLGLEKITKPSKYSWAGYLARHLQLDCVNLSVPGASNKQIWKIILDTKITSKDTVVVLWSHVIRSCLFKSDKEVIRLLPSDINRSLSGYLLPRNNLSGKVYANSKLTEQFYKKLYYEDDHLIDTFNRINHIDYYLKSKGVDVYHFCVDQILNKNIPKWNVSKFHCLEFDYTLGYASDHAHPSAKSQEKMSKEMLKIMDIHND